MMKATTFRNNSIFFRTDLRVLLCSFSQRLQGADLTIYTVERCCLTSRLLFAFRHSPATKSNSIVTLQTVPQFKELCFFHKIQHVFWNQFSLHWVKYLWGKYTYRYVLEYTQIHSAKRHRKWIKNGSKFKNNIASFKYM